jgi:hypothetical protein
MRDLYVFIADADMEAVVRSVLARPLSIGIRPITSDFRRHTGRDAGMIKDGPELVRTSNLKNQFEKVILIWDYHGSGSKSHTRSRDDIRLRLRQVTWQNRSEAVVIVPELEEWLWHDQDALAPLLKTDPAGLQQLVQNFADKRNQPPAICKRECPKELFEHCYYQAYRCRPIQQDFGRIATIANLAAWGTSTSFAVFVDTLRYWFPPTATATPVP